ncbi:uncharacterized protein RCO7_10126 [Rhynchosporium graminicola]|uniref:Uncharacterized protein n=1 Tax=Rhynchosporium graminicola TaxID=2792576 RepID=A0A1E1K919_9HELO|nr:uncharacterized protein RCO7_10126 [Rhynchosporium commune]
MSTTPILFDYRKTQPLTKNVQNLSNLETAGSPYSQKIHLFCAAAGVTIKSCEQAPVLPRPTLDNLGITYRRIPVLAIGKDIFADSSLIIDVLGALGQLKSDPAAKAFEVFANSLFQVALRIAPPALLEPSFVKDREDIFPILGDKDYASLRPSALADIRASFEVIEREFLARGTTFIDAFGMNKEPGFEKKDFPKLYTWLANLPSKQAQNISDEEAVEAIKNGKYIVQEAPAVRNDPLGLKLGDSVTIETTDSTAGSSPQHGKLASLRIDTVAIELENQLRLHFPRRGVLVKKV